MIRGENLGGQPGSDVSGAGDINGDGIPDLAISASDASRGPLFLSGTVYPVFGPPREGVPRFHRGDPNSSGTIDISDAIAIFGNLFLGDPATLSCRESADSNNDGAVDISDGIYLLSWLFTGGPEPSAPGPAGISCGFDPDPPGSSGDLGCESYSCI